MERRGEHRAERTRERLLDAAEREFAARGFPGARLRAIAEGAGVQPALIHHYFADKRGLYRAVLDRALEKTSLDTTTILAEEREIEPLVARLVGRLVDFCVEHRHLFSLLRLEAAGGGETVLLEVVRARCSPVSNALLTLLRDKQASGELRRDLQPEEVLILAISTVLHPFTDGEVLSALLPGPMPRDEEAVARRKHAIAGLLLDGLRGRG